MLFLAFLTQIPMPISGDLGRPLAGGVVVTACSWRLTAYFTRKRRLSRPSIVLAIGHGLGASILVTAAVAMMLGLTHLNLADDKTVLPVAALAVAGGYYVQWRRFAVPITVAFCAIAVLAGIFAALLTLSAFWNPARQAVVRLLPGRLRAVLPVIAKTYKVRTR